PQFSPVRLPQRRHDHYRFSRSPAYLVRYPPDLLRCRYFLPQELRSVIVLNGVDQSAIRMIRKNLAFLFLAFLCWSSCKNKEATAVLAQNKKPIVSDGGKSID